MHVTKQRYPFRSLTPLHATWLRTHEHHRTICTTHNIFVRKGKKELQSRNNFIHVSPKRTKKKIEDSAAAESLGEQSQSSASCRRRDGTLTKKINDLQVHSGERRNRKEHVAALQSIDIENLTIVSSSWCRTTKIHSFVMYKESVRKERQHPSHSTFQFNIARLNTFSKINILFYFICSHSTYILGE